MDSVRKQLTADQTVTHLRDGIHRGKWAGELLGTLAMAQHLGVSKDAVRAAFVRLEKEGLIISQGPGKPRLVRRGLRKSKARAFRVGILLNRPPEDESLEMRQFILSLQYHLRDGGYEFHIAPKTVSCIAGNPAALQTLISKSPADGWVVICAQREILDWFCERKILTFAYGGRSFELPIATFGVNYTSGMAKLTRLLLEMGHRRISMLVPPDWKEPCPNRIVAAFLQELQCVSPSHSSYFLPPWNFDPQSFNERLEQLFRISPPSTLIIDAASRIGPVLAFLANRRIRVPEDLSLFCMAKEESLEWFRPKIAHFSYDLGRPTDRIMQWLNLAGKGRQDTTQWVVETTIDIGESLAPPKKSLR
ncbi:MAG: transcriptional regulator [Akkermansiaceae bacterium]|nr:transcriptional regulator [Akkermansiaceae bacterium]